jgi:hypothetical protein
MKTAKVLIAKKVFDLEVVKENYHTFWVRIAGRHVKRKKQRDLIGDISH